MKLVVISPESDDLREHAVLDGLFSAGLERFHVRKPQYSREKLVAWLKAIPEKWRPRLVLHHHHELVDEFGLGGRHWPDGLASQLPSAGEGWTSRACHDLATLRMAFGNYDAVFFSPVFPSISKPGYRPRVELDAVASCLRTRSAGERRTSVIALGGITPENCTRCRQLGFDGVAVLGALWQAAEPLEVFHQLQFSLLRHAA